MRTRTLLSMGIALLVFLVSAPVTASDDSDGEFEDLVEEFEDLFEEYEDLGEEFDDFVEEVLEDPEEFDEEFDELAEDVGEFMEEFDELFDELEEEFPWATPLSSTGVRTEVIPAIPDGILFADVDGNLIIVEPLNELALTGTLDGVELFTDILVIRGSTGEFLFHGTGVFIGRVDGKPGPGIDGVLINPFAGRGVLGGPEPFVINKFAFRGGPGLANVHILGTAVSDTVAPFTLSGLTFGC